MRIVQLTASRLIYVVLSHAYETSDTIVGECVRQTVIQLVLLCKYVPRETTTRQITENLPVRDNIPNEGVCCSKKCQVLPASEFCIRHGVKPQFHERGSSITPLHKYSGGAYAHYEQRPNNTGTSACCLRGGVCASLVCCNVTSSNNKKGPNFRDRAGVVHSSTQAQQRKERTNEYQGFALLRRDKGMRYSAGILSTEGSAACLL